jgi:hypothetical protein
MQLLFVEELRLAAHQLEVLGGEFGVEGGDALLELPYCERQVGERYFVLPVVT